MYHGNSTKCCRHMQWQLQKVEEWRRFMNINMNIAGIYFKPDIASV